MNQRPLLAALVLTLVALWRATPAAAEPYLAVEEGYKCNVCHVNPTGGGLRNDFGLTYAKVLLPAETVDNTLDSWNGKITDRLRVGGDLRTDWSRDTAPNSPSQQPFSSSNSAYMPISPLFPTASEYMSMNRSRRTVRRTKKRTCATATRRTAFISRGVNFTCPSAGGCRTRPHSCVKTPASA